MKKILALAALLVLGLGVETAAAVTKTFNWTWPTTRTDGTALALTGIGGVTLYDTSLPSPGTPGTVVACPATIPPTTATGTCQANVTPGHSFGITVSDTASPPDVSAISNIVSVPLSAPSAVTNLTVQ
ncbi:MAG TPA: hypothetical protein VF748_15060 [Candidatus Acidoferrum sp.]